MEMRKNNPSRCNKKTTIHIDVMGLGETIHFSRLLDVLSYGWVESLCWFLISYIKCADFRLVIFAKLDVWPPSVIWNDLCPIPNTLTFPIALQIWFCDPNNLLIEPKFMPMFQAFPSFLLSVFSKFSRQKGSASKPIGLHWTSFACTKIHSHGQLKWLVMYKPMTILFNYVQNKYFLNSNIQKSLFYNIMYYENI
jgi:hypothetical protein